VGTACALGRVRTDDPRFTKPVLFQLSYKGMAGRQGVEPCTPGFGVQTAPGARPTRVKKKCRPQESNLVLLLFRQAREPSTPGRQARCCEAPLQGIEPCSRGRRPRCDPIASRSKRGRLEGLEPSRTGVTTRWLTLRHQPTSNRGTWNRTRTTRVSDECPTIGPCPVMPRVWVAGLEPATSRIRTVRSTQAELHPEKSG
jgi:hypothetical protein